jgi:outer membrane murein-binding lipoprotein Lpp
MASSESELLAQQVSSLNQKLAELETDGRVRKGQRASGAGCSDAARAMQEISRHWDAVYEAMRRVEESE